MLGWDGVVLARGEVMCLLELAFLVGLYFVIFINFYVNLCSCPVYKTFFE